MKHLARGDSWNRRSQRKISAGKKFQPPWGLNPGKLFFGALALAAGLTFYRAFRLQPGDRPTMAPKTPEKKQENDFFGENTP